MEEKLLEWTFCCSSLECAKNSSGIVGKQYRKYAFKIENV